MLTRETRPLTEAERAAFATPAREHPVVRLGGGCCCLGPMLLVVAVLLVMLAGVAWLGYTNLADPADRVSTPGFLAVLAILAGIILWLLAWVLGGMWRDRHARTPTPPVLPADATVTVYHVTATAAARIADSADGEEKATDTWGGYVLDIGEGHLLFVRDIAFDELAAAGRFPVTRFDVDYLAARDLILRVEPLGAPLPVTRTRGPLTPAEASALSDFQVFPGALATLDADLRKLAHSDRAEPAPGE